MARLSIDLRPQQDDITRDRIREMHSWTPRRRQLSQWTALHPPDNEDERWWILLPFCETLKNAFTSMVSWTATNGLKRVKKDRCWALVNGSSERVLGEIRDWEETVSPYVAQRDCLALSFSLDFDRVRGNPEEDRTEIGRLRRRAKPYGREPKAGHFRAAENLVDRLMSFLERMGCYDFATVVAAVPPSDPKKPFDLPTYLAKRVAEELELPDGTDAVRTTRKRDSAKTASLEEKLDLLEGTVGVDDEAFVGSNVLLIDDLYQSGTSINFVGMKLLQAGAERIYGLTCEKTCRNDANV